MSALGARRGCAGRKAWACQCAQAGRAGWLNWANLVHYAPGSVLTQFLTGLTRYYSGVTK